MDYHISPTVSVYITDKHGITVDIHIRCICNDSSADDASVRSAEQSHKLPRAVRRTHFNNIVIPVAVHVPRKRLGNLFIV